LSKPSGRREVSRTMWSRRSAGHNCRSSWHL
jgi:hypothetical protein